MTCIRVWCYDVTRNEVAAVYASPRKLVWIVCHLNLFFLGGGGGICLFRPICYVSCRVCDILSYTGWQTPCSCSEYYFRNISLGLISDSAVSVWCFSACPQHKQLHWGHATVWSCECEPQTGDWIHYDGTGLGRYTVTVSMFLHRCVTMVAAAWSMGHERNSVNSKA